MASLQQHSLHFLFLLISSLFISISGKHESESGKTQHYFHSTISSTVNRRLQNNNLVRKLDESANPVTNPANFPPITPTPTIVTVPSSNPTTPVDSFPTTPPTTTTVPASTTPTTTPITNPANPGTNPPIMNPNPPPNQPTSGPISSGSSWCVANTGASETQLQSGLDYACGIGGADCSTIQQGGSCYDPNSLQNHASFAFNSYYQKNPSPQSCDFGGAAVLVNTNPSTGSCVYPTSASGAGAGAGAGTAMPASTTPPTTDTPSSTFPSPTTTTSPGTFGSASGGPASGTFGSPPSLTNPSNNPNSLFPASYGPDSPPSGSTYPSGSAALRPDIRFVILVVSFFTGKLLLSI